MLDKTNVKTLDKVVVRFSGDSGDGMPSPTIRPKYAPPKVRSAECQAFR